MHHAFMDLLWQEFRNEHQISDPTLEYPSSEYWTDYPVRERVYATDAGKAN